MSPSTLTNQINKGGKDRPQLESLNLPDAAKRRSDSYKSGMVVEFNEKAKRKVLGVQVSLTYNPASGGPESARRCRRGVFPSSWPRPQRHHR